MVDCHLWLTFVLLVPLMSRCPRPISHERGRPGGRPLDLTDRSLYVANQVVWATAILSSIARPWIKIALI